MNGQLNGKRCIVTGGARGIGRSISIELARRGAAAVTMMGTNETVGAEAIDDVSSQGAKATFIRCDISDETEVEKAVAGAAEVMGGIDVLINNAAVVDSNLTEALRLDEIPREVWDRIQGVNVRGTWLMTKYAVPHLAKGQNPVILNSASVSGGAVAIEGEACYGTTKAAIIAMTKAAAADFRPLGIRAVSYSPGTIKTDAIQEIAEQMPDPDAAMREWAGWHLTPFEPRLGDPIEVARVACFLASDEASFINGVDVRIDAGLTVWRGSA